MIDSRDAPLVLRRSAPPHDAAPPSKRARLAPPQCVCAAGQVIAAGPLPFDVWVLVFAHLSVSTLCILRETSKTLCAFVEERAVWHDAVADILLAKPLPHLQRSVPFLSATELRAVAVRSVRVDRAFGRRAYAPRLVLDVDAEDIVRAQLLPCGQRLITVSRSGTLALRAVAGPAALATLITLAVAPPPPPQWPEPNFSDYRVHPISMHESLVLQVLAWRNPVAPNFYDNDKVLFRLFRADAGGLRPLTTLRASHPEYYGMCAVSEHALAYMFMHPDGSFFVCVRSLDKAGRSTRGVLMRFPEHCPIRVIGEGSMALLGPDRLLIVTSKGIAVYRVPPLGTANSDEDEDLPIIDVVAIWAQLGAYQNEYPVINTAAPYGAHGARGRCVAWTGKEIQLVDVPLSGNPQGAEYRSEATVIEPLNTYALLASVGHTAGLQGGSRYTNLANPTFSLVYPGENGEGERGVMRLGRADRLAVRAGYMHGLIGERDHILNDMSIDELSGRIAVLVRADCSERLRVFDLM